jgi:hypothetical protein
LGQTDPRLTRNALYLELRKDGQERGLAYQALFRPELDAEAGTVKKILDHIGESTQPPRIAPARGQPLWEAAAAAEQAENDPQWDSSTQPAPEVEFDQRIAW